MGVRAGLTEIPPNLFEQIIAGSEPELPSKPRYSIDKAWYDFHIVFETLGSPLNVAISGDILHPLSPHNFNEFLSEEHDYYVGFISPHVVCQVAEKLRDSSTEDYNRWAKEATGEEYNCGETFFSELKLAYENVAIKNNALMIVIA